MKIQEFNPDFKNLIVLSRVLDKRGTKQTSLMLDATYNKFYVVDDDDNAYLLNPDYNEPEYIQTILEILNSILNEVDKCPECLISRLDEIKDTLSLINNDDVIELINSTTIELINSIEISNQSIMNELELIKDKVKNETIIVKEVIKEVIKEVVKIKYEKYIEYIEVRTTKYVPSCKKRPDKIETLPPSNIPPSSIPGWIYDQINGYYYKIKRGIKYIKINKNVWREDEYVKLFKTTKERSHWHFGKTQ